MNERRQHTRLDPGLPLFVHLGEYTETLSNLSEGGLALRTRLPETQGVMIALSVELPDRGSPLRAVAQIRWTSDTQNLTGLQFVDLPDFSRQQLREWMSARAAAAARKPPTLSTSETATEVKRAAVLSLPSLGLRPTEQAVSGRLTKWRRWAIYLLTAGVSWSAWFTFGLYLGRRGAHPASRAQNAARDNAVEPSGRKIEFTANPSANPAVPSEELLGGSGLVLQVGAMKYENDAESLASTLQKSGFPAFVFKRVSDRLYKVAVGPFASAESAATAQRKLESRGFKAILLPWSPE